MAYDDTKWGGFAKIIVDTSTLTAGDTVRVRSMTDANAIYDKTVVTAGTPLLFETEIFKDYVKICTVQDIGGVATEIGGVYRTVDYGQTLFIEVLDKTTIQGIQGILNSHTENYALNIGDEVTIKINDGGTPKDWVMQIGAIDLYDSHEVIFVSKHCWGTSAAGDSNGYPYYQSNNPMRKKMVDFYNAIDSSQRSLLKETLRESRNWGSTSLWQSFDVCTWLPNTYEVFALNQGGNIVKQQYPIFLTQGDRVRTLNGSASAWWTCDGSTTNNYYTSVSSVGTASNDTYSNTSGLVPCFRLTADS